MEESDKLAALVIELVNQEESISTLSRDLYIQKGKAKELADKIVAIAPASSFLVERDEKCIYVSINEDGKVLVVPNPPIFK